MVVLIHRQTREPLCTDDGTGARVMIFDGYFAASLWRKEHDCEESYRVIGCYMVPNPERFR